MTDDNREDPWLRKSPPPRAAAPRRAAGAGDDKPGWERDLLERLAFATLKEQRRSRRWGIFFKAATLLYLVALLFMFNQDAWQQDGIVKGKHTALVDVRGVIADDQDANADTIVSGLRAAFKNKNSAGVIIRINSPGGSPVQAGYVNDEIARLRAKYPDKPIYAVVTDICASGGYYIAAAADEIYADKASLVGSIGVLMDGFGFVETMKKLGVERRLITAGENKGFMDPFSPQREEDRQHIQNMLDTIHQQFIATVRKGRGERLKESEELFSGLIWTGEQGVELGLVDGLGSSSYVAREIIGAEKIVDYTDHRPYFEQLVERLGSGVAQALAGMVKGSLQ
ncbi:MAG TPA: signal peptide peptidase SppA [Gammaproteobacteria bacterium]|nr:signal peptide peptidase SppA [Gammaproteobacteria bacterium]